MLINNYTNYQPMNLEITLADTDARPEIGAPDPEILKYLGEEGLRKLVSDHYDLLAQSEIQSMFPKPGKGLEIAKKRSADFLIQRCGGPAHYYKTRGNPMLRKRHIPFRIAPADRVVWLNCFREALINTHMPDYLKQAFWDYIHPFSLYMVTAK